MSGEQGTPEERRDEATDRSPRSVPADEPFYTIGQVAALLDVPAAQLRRLDALAVVQPERSEGNQRRYTSEEIERLREVVALGDEGVTLPGVRKILELRRRVDELEEQLAHERARRA